MIQNSARALLPNRYGGTRDITLTVEGLASTDYWVNQEIAQGPGFAPDYVLEAIARGLMEWGAIAPYIDLPRSIAELKDFKDVFKSIHRNLVRFRSRLPSSFTLGEALRSVLISTKRKGDNLITKRPTVIGSLLDAGISADLTWKFAVRPLIEDVQRCFELSAKAEELMIKMAMPKPVLVKGRAKTTSTTGALTESAEYFTSVRTSWTNTHTCVAWAKIQPQPVQASFTDALKEVAGLRARWQTAWELVPLSFVVDWFVGVGKTIGYFDRQSPPQGITILSSGYSHKKERQGFGTMHPFKDVFDQLGAPFVLTPVGCGGVLSKSYVRTPRLIAASEVTLPPIPELSLPNLGQCWTLAELIYGMLPTKGRAGTNKQQTE